MVYEPSTQTLAVTVEAEFQLFYGVTVPMLLNRVTPLLCFLMKVIEDQDSEITINNFVAIFLEMRADMGTVADFYIRNDYTNKLETKHVTITPNH